MKHLRLLILIPLTLLLTGSVTQQHLMVVARKNVAAGGGYSAAQATFDGANDRVHFSSSAVTFTAGKALTVSIWINSSTAASKLIIQGRNGTAGTQWRFRTDAGGTRFDFYAGDSAGTAVLNGYTDANISLSGWNHILFSVDLTSASNRHVWINGVDSTDTWTTYSNTDMALDRTDIYIGADDANGSDLNGCLAEIWMDDVYTDFSSSTNREKFALAGVPVDLGSDGSTPFAAAPDLYMKFVSGSLGVNSGGDGGTATLDGDVADGACGTISY